MGTIITTIIIIGGCVVAFFWTRNANGRAGVKCSGKKNGCAGCTETSCPAYRAIPADPNAENAADDEPESSFEAFKRHQEERMDRVEKTLIRRSDKKENAAFLAIAFDLDGTLLDTAADLTDAVNFTRKTLGLESLSKEEVKPKLGGGINNLLRCTLPEDLTEEEFEEKRAVFADKYNEICENRTYAYEGVKPVLEQLKESGYSLAVITNKNDDTAKRLVNSFFPGLFSVVRGRVGELRKPDPKMMEDTLKELGVSATQTLFVGDSEVDRQFGEASGVATVLVSWGFRDRADIEKITPQEYIIDSPQELFKYL